MPDIEPPTATQLGPAPNITSGASVRPIYVTRTMKVYGLHEYELATLSTLNAGATTLIGAASFIASAAIGIYTNSLFANELTAEGRLATKYVAPVFIAASILSAIFAGYLIYRRRGIIDAIKRESESI